MRVPEDVSRTVHDYSAFRAVLLAARRHDPPIRSLVCPGLGTGAWLQGHGEPRLPSLQRIHTQHLAMKTVD